MHSRWIVPLVAIASSPALADPPALTPLTEPATVTVTDSYRSQTLTADGLAIGAALLGAGLEGPDGRDTSATKALYPLALIGGMFATPIIHGVHGHPGRAVGSYFLRSATMTAGMLIALETASCGGREFLCGLDSIGPGMLGGFIVAAAIDAAFMTDETHEEPVRAARTWAPVVTPHHGGATAGLAMTF